MKRFLLGLLTFGMILGNSVASGDLVLSVSVYPSAVRYEDSLNFTVSVTNTGPETAFDTLLVTSIPSHWGSLHNGTDTDGGSCGDGKWCNSPAQIKWNLGTLGPGQARSVVLSPEAGVTTWHMPEGNELNNVFRASASNASDVTTNVRVVIGDATGNDPVTSSNSGPVYPPNTDGTTGGNTDTTPSNNTSVVQPAGGCGPMGVIPLLLTGVGLCFLRHRGQ